MAGEKQRPNRRTRFGTIWGELEYVCRRVHYWLHERKDKARARRPLRRLERLLRMVPENELAIIRQEGFALLYELKDELTHAIQHRKREIELMEKLHEDVATGGYEETTKVFILTGRDAAALEARRSILRTLEEAERRGRADEESLT